MKQVKFFILSILSCCLFGAFAIAQARPQDPQAPFPYQSIEVAYDNLNAQDVRLAGTLVIPEGEQPFPVALFISGSGLQDRDQTIFNHRPFSVVADYLARRGIASLRVDDRGFGESTGDVQNATTLDFASDVEAGIAFLKTRPEISQENIGLIGHSEGGIIAPIVAAEPENKISFIVLLAGTGVPGDRVLLEQVVASARAQGMSDQELEAQRQLARMIIETAKESQDSPEILTEQLVEISIDHLTSAGAIGDNTSRRELRQIREDLENEMQFFASPWQRFFLNYDPASSLTELKSSVLALNGSNDLQVDSQMNLSGIRSALENSEHPDFTVLEVSRVNHLFQTSDTGSVDEYEEIEETISPYVLGIIGDWIEQRIE